MAYMKSFLSSNPRDAGLYTAKVTLASQDSNYDSPVLEDLVWTIQPAVVPALKGDATNDGAVDILDLVSIIDYIVSNTSPASPANADANGDGSIDILDLVWIIDKIVGS